MIKPKQAIGVLITFCVITFLIRVLLTKSFFFGFLLWNLFLAIIPYLIALGLKSSNSSGFMRYLGMAIWLLFLPNAPYLITDFVHLHHLKSTLLWYDLYMLFTFAFTGLLLAILSMDIMYRLMRQTNTQIMTNVWMFIWCFLAGYGIYLGRFLRFNSWDVVSQPKILITQILQSFATPNTWFTTMASGILLCITFLIFKSLQLPMK